MSIINSPTNYLKFKNNTQIIEVLNIFLNFYNIQKDIIHINSYQKAIYYLKRLNKEIKDKNDVKDLEGIGKGMIDKITAILNTGTHPDILNKKMIEIINANNSSLNNLLGFGSSLTKNLADKYNIKNLNELNQRMNISPIQLPRIAYIGWLYQNDLSKLIHRNDITYFFKNIFTPAIISINKLLKKQNYKINIELAGSYPSGKEYTKDIDILLFATKISNKTNTKKFKNEKKNKTKKIDMKNYINNNENKIINNILDLVINYFNNNNNQNYNNNENYNYNNDKNEKRIIEIISKGKYKSMLIMNIANNIKETRQLAHIDLLVYPEDEKEYAHLYFTSGKIFNQMIRQKAKKLGYKLNDKGLFKNDKKILIAKPILQNLFNILHLNYKLYDTRY